MAIVLQEPIAEACKAALAAQDQILMSAGSLAEVLIVSTGRGIAAEMEELLGRFDFDIVLVPPGMARRVGQAYGQWGRGMHPGSAQFRRLLRLCAGERARLPAPLCRRRLRQDRCR